MTVSEFINKIGFKVKDDDVKKVNSTISNIKSTATKLLGTIGIGLSLTAINSLVEEFDAVNDKINYTVQGLGDVKSAQKDILDAANSVKMSYSSMAGVVTNLVKSNSEMFPVDEAISFSTNLTKLMKSAGRNDSEITSIMEGMNKSFQKGAVDTETLNKMLEQAPETANYLAERLGVAKTQLLELASSGKISVTDLKNAFVGSSEEIENAFSQLNFSVSDAILNIRNKWGFWLKETDEMLGLTQTIGKTMVSAFDKVMSALNRVRNGVVWLSDKLGGMQNMLRLIGIVAGVAFAVFNFDKITKGLTAVSKLLTGVKAKTLAIIAIVVLLALLVDDFINFMQGNDSVIGTLLANAGVDVDKFRESIITIWGKIKTALGAIWQGIKNVAIPIFQGIWQFIKDVFDKIGDIISAVAPGVADFIDQLANGEIDTEKWVQVGETIAKIAVAIAGVVVAIKTVITVVKTVTTIISGIGTVISFLTSPIGLVVLAIAAVIAIVIICIKNWDKIKAAFLSAWEAIKSAWSKVVDFFKGIWDGIVSAFSSVVEWFRNLFQSAWDGIVSIWNAVIGWFQSVWDGIVGVFSAVGTWFTEKFTEAWENIKAVFSTVGEFFQGVWDTIVSLFTSIGTAVGDAISGAVKGAINAVLSGAITIINGFISAINLAIGIINKIPGVSISKLNTLDVPQLAEGGYVRPNKPQAVVIGDNKREGEIVSPISKMRDTVLEAMQLFAASAKPSATTQMLSSSVSTTRSIVQNVNINNKFEGDKAIQQKAAGAMDKSAQDVTSELARGLAYAR